jgi:hypothetical protein
VKKKAKKLVDALGICLVYPIANKKEPPSLWHALWPNSQMDWSWDSGADDRVAELWHLRARLAESHDVAYGKWFKGRATFFSLPVFHALLGRVCKMGDPFADLPPAAHDILALLRERSPLSTKLLRQEAGLRGKQHDRAYNQAMRMLWSRLLIVGVGEVEDGAFPSLAVGATELVFEDLWLSRANVSAASRNQLDAALSRSKAFEKEHDRVLVDLRVTALRPKSTAKRIYSYGDL